LLILASQGPGPPFNRKEENAGIPWFRPVLRLFYKVIPGLFLIIPSYSCPRGAHPWGYILGVERIMRNRRIYTFKQRIIVFEILVLLVQPSFL